MAGDYPMNEPSPSLSTTFRYRMTLQYDGFNYAGWQVQPHHLTIQQVIETVLAKITSEQVKIHGSGRTDQGVHAKGQVAHFELQQFRAPADLLRALNSLLPPDIRIDAIRKTSSLFHARRSAIAKEYRYMIWNGPIMPPFLHRYRMHARKTLDIKLMNEAASYLVGEHDFAAFSANPSREIESTIRHLMILTVQRKGHTVTIRARGNGFLYKMVRSLAGFLIRVGEAAVSPSTAQDILKSRIRTARVPTAPPQGLFLWKVWY